jgi:hypothetical protein
MTTVSQGVHSPVIPELGNGKGMVRERFNGEKDSVIENAMGKEESWAKKVGTGQSGVKLDDIERLLRALGLQVVDANAVCVDRRIHEAYRVLAAAAITEPEKLLLAQHAG